MRLDVDHVGGQRGTEPSSGILTERTAPGDQAHPAVLTRDRSCNDSVTRVLDAHREAKLRKDYAAINKLTKMLPATKAARYRQIEGKIRAAIRHELAANIPLVE